MPWEGYNYEDAILISESLVKYDTLLLFIFKSMRHRPGIPSLALRNHPDIPNVGEDVLKDLIPGV